MVARIRIQVTAEFEIDPKAYIAAAIEAEWAELEELNPTDYEAVAEHAVAYMAAEDNLPCWARDSVRVIRETTEVLPESPEEAQSSTFYEPSDARRYALETGYCRGCIPEVGSHNYQGTSDRCGICGGLR